jgi:hypothetical protein
MNSIYPLLSVDLNFNVNEQVSWIAYSLDGGSNVTISGNTTISSMSEGSHTIVAYATDTTGNTGSSSMVQFTISIPSPDTTPPTITIISPQETTYTTSEIDYTLSEPVTWTAYSLDGEENVTITSPTIISGLSVGSHGITVFANDTAGNTGSSGVVEFIVATTTIDTMAPIIVVDSPTNTTYDTNKISLSFVVNEEPTLKFYSLDGKANTTVVDSIVLSNLSVGEHRLIMYAEDLAGNMGASQQVTFTIAKSNEDRQLWIVGLIAIVAITGFIFSAYIAHDLIKSSHK